MFKTPIRTAAVAACLLLAPSVRAEEKWQEATSENFVLVTNASEAQAQSILETLERFRYALGQVIPEIRLHSSVPTRVYGFRDFESFEPFLPSSERKGSKITGYFRGSIASNIIVIDLTAGAAAAERVLFHEYVHVVVNLSGRDLPVWFEEGLSEFYAGTRLGRDNAEVGVSDERHRALLSWNPLHPLEDLLRVEKEEDLDALFYAQSWALVHYLLVEAPEGRKRLARFLTMENGGADPVSAFRDSFGEEPRVLQEAFREYLKKSRWSGIRVELATMPARSVESRRLLMAEVQERWGELFTATGRLKEARICLEEAVRRAPDLGSAREAFGLLLLAEGDRVEARAQLQRAIRLGAASPSALYEYAKLLLDEYSRGRVDRIPDPIAAEASAALRESISRDPSARDPAELLAFVYLVRGERLEEAEALLMTALAVAPNDTSLLYLKAQLLAKQGHYDGATTILRRLVEETSDARLRAEAEKFLARMMELQRAPGK